MTSFASVSLAMSASAAARADHIGACGEPDGLVGDDLRLAQLLCSRLCHDLIGAAGAISNGVELLGEEAADRADICELLGLSGRQLNRRLAFYRHAFAMTGRRGGASSLAEARRLAADLLADTRVTLEWRDHGTATGWTDGLSSGLVRVLLCAILISADGLPRGGSLNVGITRREPELALTIDGDGRDAELSPPVLAALDPLAAAETITARTVPAHYLGRLAHGLGARIDVATRPGGFTLKIATVRP